MRPLSPAEPSSLQEPNGFTLLEVLVAFTICALMLGVFLQVFSGGLRQNRVTDGYSTALLHAESLLAAVGKTEALFPGEREGRIGDRFRWKLTVQAYEEGTNLFEQGPLAPYQVTLTLYWIERNDERSLSLSTLRVAKRG